MQTAGHYFCIYTTDSATYALYVTFKLLLRHVLPAILILLCILRPRSASLHLSIYPLLTASVYRTVVAKRISLILMGPPAVCECGPSGAVLARPHECPKMARSRPDILRDTETTDMMAVTQLAPEKV